MAKTIYVIDGARTPLLLSDAIVLWLSGFYAAKTLGQKAAVVARLKFGKKSGRGY